jgi:hypothetical protein
MFTSFSGLLKHVEENSVVTSQISVVHLRADRAREIREFTLYIHDLNHTSQRFNHSDSLLALEHLLVHVHIDYM